MKLIPSFSNRHHNAASLSISALFGFMLLIGGCKNEQEISLSNIEDANSSDVPTVVYINNEQIKDASVQFTEIPGTDSVNLVMTGVHPTETISLKAVTSRDDNGRILFSGEESVKSFYINQKGFRHLKVEGCFITPESPVTLYQTNSSVKINITYTVPQIPDTKKYYIPINETSGFHYNHDFQHRHAITENQIASRMDSCEFISQRINSELSKHLKSIAFSFENNGNMTFEYTTSNQQVIKQTFRYWMRMDGCNNYIMDIEKPSSFYESILNAMTPVSNRSIFETLSYESENKTATIYINDYITNIFKGIAITYDFQHKIFPYLQLILPTDNGWSESEKKYLTAIEREAKNLYPSHDNYTWLFTTAEFK